jgi:hypothetical protein
MTGINHATTGILIALAVPRPSIAIPLAFISHFILDKLPHWDNVQANGSHAWFRRYIFIEALLGVAFSICMMLWIPGQWLLIMIGALAALLPDFMWLPNFVRQMRKRSVRPHNRLMRWHENIQFERRWGIYVEIIWFVLIVATLLYFAFGVTT